MTKIHETTPSEIIGHRGGELGMISKCHEFGEVHISDNAVSVEASAYELDEWAHRPGAVWPCSTLARLDSILATFDTNGLVDIEHPGADDIPSDELNAWSGDVLRDILPTDHPCYFVTVGQFEG